MRYKLVIFDFDGTLADSFPWLLSVLDRLSDKYHLKRMKKDEIEMLRGYTARQMLEHYRVPFWKMLLIGNDFRGWMARDIDQIHLFAGIDRLLRHLAGLGIQLALVTSNTSVNVRRVLGPENAGLIQYYECGVSFLGKEGKFEKILRRSGVPRAEAICIGDEVRDIEAAQKVHIPFGAVTWGYSRAEALVALAPQMVFNNIDEMIEKLG